MVSTFGLYMLPWLAINRGIAETRIGQPHRPTAAWLLILVPIANLFIYYGALDVVQKGVRARRSSGPIAFWIYGFFAYVGLTVLCVPIIQTYIYHADMLDRAHPTDKPRLTAAEIVVIVVGLLIELVLIIGESGTDSDEALGFFIVLLAAFPFLVLPFWLVTRRINALVAEAQMTTCPSCLSPMPKAATVCRTCHRDVPVQT